MASKPTAVSGPGVAAFGDKIYTFGGNHYGSMQSVIEVYDPATNSWASVGNMPVAGESWTAAVMGGKIYLAGGNFPSTGGYTTHLWPYDPISGSWDTSLPSLSSRSMFHELVAVGNHLLAIGGCGVDGIPAHGILASVESWTPGASAWTMDTSLNTARFQFGAEAIGSTIYVFGGHSGVENLASTESANVVPVPAAAWLAVLGMGVATRQLRRRKMR